MPALQASQQKYLWGCLVSILVPNEYASRALGGNNPELCLHGSQYFNLKKLRWDDFHCRDFIDYHTREWPWMTKQKQSHLWDRNWYHIICIYVNETDLTLSQYKLIVNSWINNIVII